MRNHLPLPLPNTETAALHFLSQWLLSMLENQILTNTCKLSIPSSGTECWTGTVGAVLVWVQVKTCYKHLALPYIFYFFLFPFFLFLSSLSPWLPFAAWHQITKKLNLKSLEQLPNLTAAIKPSEVGYEWKQEFPLRNLALVILPQQHFKAKLFLPLPGQLPPSATTQSSWAH